MKVFYSSKKLFIDKDLNLIFLDTDNIDNVTPNDIVMGVGSFRDELIIKSLINMGTLPFFITLNSGLDIISTFKYLSLVLDVENYFVNSKTIDKIVEFKNIINQFQHYNDQLKEQSKKDEHLKELLLNNQRLINHFVLKKGQKGVVDKIKIELEEIYIYERVGKRYKTVYVILQKNNYFKVFSQEVDKREKINDILIKNRFKVKFKSLMKSDQMEFSFRKNTFINITSRYKREFLIIDVTNKHLLDVELLDFGLKIYSDLNFRDIAIYKLFNRSSEIDDEAKKLLFSIHNYLKDNKNSIDDISYFFRGYNLYEAKRDRDKQANIMADVYIKFIEKIHDIEKRDKFSNFDFAIITLNEFHKFDNHILTNIFYHIVDGIGISAIIKKEFSQFIHNFSTYQDIVEEAEEELEFDDCYDELEEIVDSYPLNKRVMNSEHIDRLKTCLGDAHELVDGLNRLYKQLSFQEIGGYEIENLTTDDINKSDIENRDSYEKLVTIILNSFLNMRGFDRIKTKSLALFMSYIAYILSLEENDKSIHCCFFAFFNLYADREPEYLLLRLEKYFENRTVKVVQFFEEKDSFICKGDKIKVTLITPKYRDKSVKCEKFRKQKSRKFQQEFLKISNFFKLVSSTDKMDLAIQSFIDRVVSNQIDSIKYCKYEVTIEFLKIFFSVGKKCDSYLSNFFNLVQEEHQNINL